MTIVASHYHELQLLSFIRRYMCYVRKEGLCYQRYRNLHRKITSRSCRVSSRSKDPRLCRGRSFDHATSSRCAPNDVYFPFVFSKLSFDKARLCNFVWSRERRTTVVIKRPINPNMNRVSLVLLRRLLLHSRATIAIINVEHRVSPSRGFRSVDASDGIFLVFLGL